MKKMFGSKKITKEKIIEFLDKKGFYVVLAACVVVVGITAFLMLKGNSGPIDRAYENEDYIPDEMGKTLKMIPKITHWLGGWCIERVFE